MEKGEDLQHWNVNSGSLCPCYNKIMKKKTKKTGHADKNHPTCTDAMTLLIKAK